MLDKTDRAILAALEKNARISNADLARAVHISRPSIIKRINRFLEEGIIEKFAAVFSLADSSRKCNSKSKVHFLYPAQMRTCALYAPCQGRTLLPLPGFERWKVDAAAAKEIGRNVSTVSRVR